jgi:nickel/cobalt exporter
MPDSFGVLAVTAASLGFIHTVFGPDHYLPFIVLAKARSWSMARTTAITLLCGLGHVLSSVVLGMVGIAVGIAVFKLEGVESARGDIAAWLLFIFGFAYLAYGIHRAVRGRPHAHEHVHGPGAEHEHVHVHGDEHVHVHGDEHADKLTARDTSAWILFIVFVFGPCEPLIPLIMYPASQAHWSQALAVGLLFSAVTIATMTAIVLAGVYGLSFVRMKGVARYSHAAAGFVIATAGALVLFAGL